MRNDPTRFSPITRFLAVLLLGIIFSFRAPAQDSPAVAPVETPAPLPADQVKFRTDDAGPHSLQMISANADYSYVAGSATKTSGNSQGSLSEQESQLGMNLRVPLDQSLSLILRTGYHRFDFSGLNSGSGIPQNLQSVGFGIGLGYKIDPQWSVFGIFSPSLQEVNGWGDSSYVHYAGVLGADYRWNDDLSLGFGLALNPGGLDDIPVLPFITAKWHFADHWTLNLGVPRSSLDFAPTKDWHFWIAPGFEGGDFKTSSTYGNQVGNPALNDQKFIYQEIRLGAGVEYKFNPCVSLTGEVGAALYRDFYFRDAADYRPASDPAPYTQIGVRVRF